MYLHLYVETSQFHYLRFQGFCLRHSVSQLYGCVKGINVYSLSRAAIFSSVLQNIRIFHECEIYVDRKIRPGFTDWHLSTPNSHERFFFLHTF